MERLVVLLPSTFTANIKNRLIRARMIGELARILTLFRVTHVFVYYEGDERFDSHGLGRYIVKLLKYAVTPPHLKKKLFPLEETDRYFGVIPPLELHSHKNGCISSLCWKVVDDGKRYSFFGRKIKATRLLLPFKDGKPLDPLFLSRDPYIGFYPHYINRDINSSLRWLKKLMGGTWILLSRYGEASKPVVKDNTVGIIVGGPFRCLLEDGGVKIERSLINYVFNILPDQPLETIHTQEALFLGLSKLLMCEGWHTGFQHLL